MNIWQDPVSMFFLGGSIFLIVGLYLGSWEKKERRDHYKHLDEVIGDEDEHSPYYLRDQE